MYGSPIVFSTKNYFGTSLLGYLNTRLYIQNESLTFQKFNTFNAAMQVMIPRYWKEQYRFKTGLSQCNVIYLNKHFEAKFEEDLCRFCYVYTSRGMQIKDSLELFCKIYSIEIDVDITFEALKQKEYRERSRVTKLFVEAKKCA